jgi:phosphoglycolate phosphatase-like HAD superfamily hydrolase
VETWLGMDFDGTIADTHVGVIETTLKTLEHFSINPKKNDLKRSLGKPLPDLFEAWSGEIDLNLASEIYLELYKNLSTKGLIVLPGVAELCAYLRSNSIKLAIISAKKQISLQRIVDEIGIEVDYLQGGVRGEDKHLSIQAIGAFAYVGDEISDIAAARRAGIISIAVTTGMRRRDELEMACPSYLIEDLTSLPTILENLINREKGP